MLRVDAGLLFHSVFHSYRFKNEMDTRNVEMSIKMSQSDSAQLIPSKKGQLLTSAYCVRKLNIDKKII